MPTDRIVLVRHGETEGESSIRFHGSGDVPLSDEGREQLRATAKRLPAEPFDLVVASPLQRASEAARILSPPGSEIRLEDGFREVHFGAWEGMTREEIQARDPQLYAQWQEDPLRFEYPEGERKAAFRARIAEGLEGVLALGALEILIVAHKGPIRTIVDLLTGAPPPQPIPELAGMLELVRDSQGWKLR